MASLMNHRCSNRACQKPLPPTTARGAGRESVCRVCGTRQSWMGASWSRRS